MHGIGAWYEFTVRCTGVPDPVTGYLADISVMDRSVREAALPKLRAALECGNQRPEPLLRTILERTARGAAYVVSGITWHLTPYYSISMDHDTMHEVLMEQQFEFAASHRLHCDALDAEENRRIFGKCNNLSGHGHNYRLAVRVATQLPPAQEGPPRCTLDDIERIVAAEVLDRFDHTHLNTDTEAFRTRNPSVENIAQVCHDLLHAPVAAAHGRLASVTVWETGKTSCTYPAPQACC